MKISFDFDNTLSKEGVQSYCKFLISQGHDIWVTTSRTLFYRDIHYDHSDLFYVMDLLGIPSEKVHFTNAEYKAPYLQQNNFILHLDDDEYEIKELEKSNVFGVNVKGGFWKDKCREIIEAFK